MTHTAYHNTWEELYLDAMAECLKTGHRRPVRNGETKAKFVTHLKYDLRDGFPIITTKLVPFDLVKAELLWFIEGGNKPNEKRNEIKGRLSTHRLSEIAGRDVKIWNGDAANFAGLEKARFDGDCGVIYGSQWRNWDGDSIDQIANLISGIKKDPYSRYHRVTAWNPGKLNDMALPACHCTFQCFVSPDEDGVMRLHLHSEQRSCDMFLGIPFNIASYSLLTHLLAQVCGYEVGEVHFTLLDYHVYVTESESHEEQVIEQLKRVPYSMPKLTLDPAIKNIDDFSMDSIQLSNYFRHPKLTAPLSTKVIDRK